MIDYAANGKTLTRNLINEIDFELCNPARKYVLSAHGKAQANKFVILVGRKVMAIAMKKFLAVLLTSLMVLSVIPVLAEGEGATGTIFDDLREWSYDFTNFTDQNSTSFSISGMAGNEVRAVDVNARENGSNAMKMKALQTVAPFSESGNTYAQMYGETNVKNDYHRFGVTVKLTTMSEGEKAVFSFDMKNDDFYYDKFAFFSKTQNINSSNGRPIYNLVKMGKDGYLYFDNEKSSMQYTLSQWYHFDVALDYSENNSVSYYLDGKLVKTIDTNFADTTKWNTSFFGFAALVSVPTEGAISTLCVDNLNFKLYSPNESFTPKRLKSPVYTDFSVPTAEGSTDKSASASAVPIGPISHGTSNPPVVDYSIIGGVFGKSRTDKALKFSANKESEFTAASNKDVEMAISALNTYHENSLGVGEKFKVSFAYAYDGEKKEQTYSYLRMRLAAEGKTLLPYLLKINADGKFSIGGSSSYGDAVTFAPYHWYNIELIGQMDENFNINLDLYVNGMPAGSGVIAKDASLTITDGRVTVDQIRLGARYVPAAAETEGVYRLKDSEMYFDEVYVNSYGSDDTPDIHNVHLKNDQTDLTTNGKIILNSSDYTVESFLEDSTADKSISVYKNGERVTEGLLNGAMVVVGEETYLPVYAYAGMPVDINVKTYDAAGCETRYLTTGEYTVKSDITINKVGESAVMIIAEFKDDVMISASTSNMLTESGTLTAKLDNVLPDSDEVKIFIFNAFTGLRPLCECVKRVFEN